MVDLVGIDIHMVRFQLHTQWVFNKFTRRYFEQFFLLYYNLLDYNKIYIDSD